jgi:carboxypeptidase family protein
MIRAINHLNPLRQNTYRKIAIPIAIILMFTITGHSQIQGGVYNENKQGIANTLLLARDTVGNIMDSVRSDKRGFYSFKSLKKGKYNIEANATGFTSKSFKNIEVINEEPAEQIGRDDISGATRLEIVLTPAKTTK